MIVLFVIVVVLYLFSSHKSKSNTTVWVYWTKFNCSDPFLSFRRFFFLFFFVLERNNICVPLLFAQMAYKWISGQCQSLQVDELWTEIVCNCHSFKFYRIFFVHCTILNFTNKDENLQNQSIRQWIIPTSISTVQIQS